MKRRALVKFLTIFIPGIFLLLYLFRRFFISLLKYIPPCPFYTALDLYCPACGNTRSTLALLQGDVLSSLRYNIVPVLLTVFVILAYVDFTTYAFGNHFRLLPRKLSFYLILIGLLVCYFILRNYFPYFTP